MYTVNYQPHIDQLRLSIKKCREQDAARKATLTLELKRIEKLAKENQGDVLERSFRIV